MVIRFFIFLLLILGISCKNATKHIQNTSHSQTSGVFKIVNPNTAYQGKIAQDDVHLLLNTKNLKEKDSIYASLYYTKEANPFQTLKSFKGIRQQDAFHLVTNDGSQITGKLIGGEFVGDLKRKNTIERLSLNMLPNYSNGQVWLQQSKAKHLIALDGATTSLPIQGELYSLGAIKQGSAMCFLLYWLSPSTGLYKSQGNCGSGFESALKIVQYSLETGQVDIQDIEVASCYNGIKAYANILFDDYSTKQLLDQWKRQQKIQFIREISRSDRLENVVVSLGTDDFLKVTENQN